MPKLFAMMLTFCVALTPMSALACADYGSAESLTQKVKNLFRKKPQITYINQLEDVPNHKHIYLKGIISKSLGKNKYVFRDKTGRIDIHIPKAVVNERKFNPKQHLYFYASVEHLSCGSIKVDVKQIKNEL